jgi:hypothetical protein
MKNGLIFILFFLFALNAHAMARTNINEVTDLFEVNIENKEQEFRELQKNNDNALENIRSENGLKLVPAMDGDVNGKIAELNAIKDTNLDDAGREKRGSEEYRFYDENEFEPSYTKPGNKMHREDAMTIAIGSRKKLDELLVELHKIGVDCKTVKGPKQKEPTFFIDLNRVPQKNTDYDLHFCELLRNKYNCTDELKVKCTRTGPRYGEWQYKTIRFGGAELHNTKADWGFAIKRCRKEWDWFITPNHPKRGVFGYGDNKQVDSIWRDNPAAIVADARVFIAGKVGAGLDQIREDIVFPPEGRGIGNQFWGVGRWRHPWEEYEFGYWYRDIYQVCELWDEDWTEECKLQ